ncbi:uncharacterized protein [Diadema setosum]|uniref:uncharacterized protein n=1 Tax=Diadema setosum TaxID=31175 RepID=UPI003B3AC026
MNFDGVLGIITTSLLAVFSQVGWRKLYGIVVVDVRPVLLRGLQGKLKCEIHGTPKTVQWRKEMNPGNAFSSSTLLIMWHENVINGESYQAGLVEFGDNYSLVIKRVDEDDAGRYHCVVTDDEGVIIENSTDVSVRDFLSVRGCSSANCFLLYDPQNTTLQCQARNVPPRDVNIYWLHNETKVSSIAYLYSRNDGDGTQNINATITTLPGLSGVFACVGESNTTHVTLQRINVTLVTPPSSATTDIIWSPILVGMLIALVSSLVAVVVFGVAYLVYRFVVRKNKEYIYELALAITKRHCQKLGEEARMKPEDIDARNRENLEWMFRTDKMLEDWVSRQKCSIYAIRCRLREAAEICNRQDVAEAKKEVPENIPLHLWCYPIIPSETEVAKYKEGILSDKVYEAGFIDLANEILTG